jgi:hypothetical protein
MRINGATLRRLRRSKPLLGKLRKTAKHLLAKYEKLPLLVERGVGGHLGYASERAVIFRKPMGCKRILRRRLEM